MILNLERIYKKEDVTPNAIAIVDKLLEEDSSKSALARVFVLKKILDEVEATLRKKAVNTIDGAKEVISGVELSTRNLTAVWDYSNCNDQTLLDTQAALIGAEAAVSDLKDVLKARQKFLQSLKEPIAIVATGEMINPAVLVEQGTTMVVQFPKK
jgi:hypothetical protein